MSVRRRQLPVGAVPIDTGTAQLLAEPGGRITLLVNGVPSSFLDLGDPRWLEFEYLQQMAEIVQLLAPTGPLTAVHLGAGGCTFPRWIEAVRPGSIQLAVDIDARLTVLVREWFDLPRSPRLRLRVGDARAVLEGLADGTADVVVRDVFALDATPPHLCTVEFTEQVRRVLRPGGMYLANCVDRPPLLQARAEAATAKAVFDDVALIAEPGQLKGRRHGNLVVAAGGGSELGSAAIDRALRCLPVPAQLLHGAQLRAFTAGAAALRDP